MGRAMWGRDLGIIDDTNLYDLECRYAPSNRVWNGDEGYALPSTFKGQNALSLLMSAAFSYQHKKCGRSVLSTPRITRATFAVMESLQGFESVILADVWDSFSQFDYWHSSWMTIIYQFRTSQFNNWMLLDDTHISIQNKSIEHLNLAVWYSRISFGNWVSPTTFFSAKDDHGHHWILR